MEIKLHCKMCQKPVVVECDDDTPRQLDTDYLDRVCSWVTCDGCMAKRERAKLRRQEPPVEEPRQAGLPYKD